MRDQSSVKVEKPGHSDVEHYRGERGRRGNKLPRGLQRVDRVEVEMIVDENISEDEEVSKGNDES